MKTILLSLILSCTLLSQAQKNNKNTKPYPFKNPVIRHMYTADPAPKVMPDGRVWMVTSVDHENGGGYETMHKYHTFSTDDMVNWTDHGEVYALDDAYGEKGDPKNQDWALWAPDMVYRNGKYYLYYPVRIRDDSKATAQGNNGISYIAVAVSDHPGKRFKLANPHIEGTEGIDPSVFIDDDGQAYLYWGDHMAARLKDNMIELAEKPVHIDLGTEDFMEAIWMDKHDGKYILSYHTLYDWRLDITNENVLDPERDQSELGYSYSDSPMGPFTFGGILNHEPGANVSATDKLFKNKNYVPWRLTLSNHGGVLEFHQNDYLFYHTSALSSWRQDEFNERGTWSQRSVCIDKLEYDKGGMPKTITQTLNGVKPVDIKQPYEIILQKDPVIVGEKQRVVSFSDVDMGSGYYYLQLQANDIEKPISAEIRKDSATGSLMGTVLIPNNGTFDTFLRRANGKYDVCIVFKGAAEISNVKLLAGSPLVN